MNYSLRLLKMAEMKIPGPDVFFMHDLNSYTTLNFFMVVARSGDQTSIINTGLPANIGYMLRYWKSEGREIYVKRAPGEEAKSALKRAGIDPNTIKNVVLSPVTTYTTGRLDLFQKARIHLLRRGWDEFISPRPPAVLPRNVVFPDHILRDLVTDWWDRVSLLEDEDEPAPGIKTYFVGGHHESSMLTVFETSIGKVGFTDAFFTLRNLQENIPIGVAEDLRRAMSVMDFAKKTCDLVIPLYDPILLKKYDNGVIVN